MIARALAFLLAASCAGAAQFHVPVQVPPHALPAAAEDGPTAWFGAGAAAARAPGMDLAGPGGLWELAGRASDRASIHVHGSGFLLKGSMDPFGAGRRLTHGFAGTLAGDLVWTPRERDDFGLYSGLQLGLTMLDVRDAVAIAVSPAQLRVEPGTAVSLVPSVPVGVLASRRAGNWRLEGAADATAHLGGKTFFTFGPGGPSAYASTRRIDFNASGGVRLRALYEPWSLSLEAIGRHAAGFGNNDPTAWGAVLLTLGAL